MKISRDLLQEIIKEELSQLIKEEELDEGFLDKLLGKGDSKFGDFVTDDEIKKKLGSVQQILGQLRGLAAKQDNKKLALGITNVSDNVAQLYKMATPSVEKSGNMPDPKMYGKKKFTSPVRRPPSMLSPVKFEEKKK